MYKFMISRWDAKLLSKRKFTEDLIELTFSCPENFSYLPGQFITFKFPQARSYSILEVNGPEIKLLVKLLEGGIASTKFKNMEIGETLPSLGPLGHFILSEDDQDVVFCASGTGIVPFYSMLHTFIKNKSRNFTLYYSVKFQKELVYHENFLSLSKSHKNFIYRPILTREKWQGLNGRIQNHINEDCKEGKTFYLCGFLPFIEGCREHLISKGIEKIKFERYN